MNTFNKETRCKALNVPKISLGYSVSWDLLANPDRRVSVRF